MKWIVADPEHLAVRGALEELAHSKELTPQAFPDVTLRTTDIFA
jgi:hypothetical protein